MDHLHYTTIEHRKGQHLSFAHRILIQTVSKLAGQPIASPGELVVRPTQFVTKSGVVQWPCTPVRFSATRRWKGKRPMNQTDRPVAVTMLFGKSGFPFFCGAEVLQGRLVSGCLCRLCVARRFVYQRADCLHQNAVRIHRPGIARDKEY